VPPGPGTSRETGPGGLAATRHRGRTRAAFVREASRLVAAMARHIARWSCPALPPRQGFTAGQE